MLRRAETPPDPVELGEPAARSGSASAATEQLSRGVSRRAREPRRRRLRLADPEPGGLRRLRARHLRASRLDDRRRPPVQHPPAAAAPEHDARRSTRRGSPTSPRSPRSRAPSCARSGACRGRCCAAAASPASAAIEWDEALDLVAERIRASDPDRLGFYLTSRGTVNETYYAAQKAVRALGTNSIDNAARVCHSPSTYGLKEALGVAATHLLLQRLDRHRPDRLHRLQRRQQPAGDDQVPAPGEEGRDQGLRRQPVSRARDGALLDPVEPRERPVRDQDRRPSSSASTSAATSASSAARSRR